MGRNKQPIDLVLAKGKKHLTKSEIQKRRNEEIKVDMTNVQPPDYLYKELREEFIEISQKLVSLGIMTELDVDCLAQYLISKKNYLTFTRKLNGSQRMNSIPGMEAFLAMQHKSYQMCRQCATDLGLTIASRCKLVIPKAETEVKANKFDRFGS